MKSVKKFRFQKVFNHLMTFFIIFIFILSTSQLTLENLDSNSKSTDNKLAISAETQSIQYISNGLNKLDNNVKQENHDIYNPTNNLITTEPSKVNDQPSKLNLNQINSINSINSSIYAGIQRNFVNVTKESYYDATPTLFFGNNSRLWIVYARSSSLSATDSNVLLSHSDDNGQTWSSPIWITDNTGVSEQTYGFVDSKGVIWIFWNYELTQGSGNKNIWYRKSIDNGNTWLNATQITSGSGSKNFPIAFQDHNNTIWVAYSYSGDIYYIQSFNNGISWTIPQKFSISSAYSENVWDVYVQSNGAIYLSVEEMNGNWGQFIWISNDNGTTWIKKQVTPYDGTRGGSFAIDSSGIFHFAGIKTDSEIYLYNSTDQGNTWIGGSKLTFTGSHGQSSIYIDKYDNFYLVTNEYYSTVDSYDIVFAKINSGYNAAYRDYFNSGGISNWKINDGNWSIANNELFLNNSNNPYTNQRYIMNPINTTGNWEVSVDVYWASGTYFEGELCAGGSFVGNTFSYWGMLLSKYTNTLIIRYSNNSYTNQVASIPMTISNGIWYNFKIINLNGNIKFFLNNVLQFTQLNAKTIGPIGQSFSLRAANGAIEKIYFDNFKIEYIKSVNNLNTYSFKLTNSNSYEDLPSIVQDKLGRIWIFYANTTSSSTVYSSPYMDIYAKYTSDNGMTWSNPIAIVKRTGNDLLPSAILIPNGTLIVFFDSDYNGNHDIWAITSSNNGLTWSQPYTIVNSTDMEGSPTSFITQNGTLWLVYTKGPNGPTRDNYYITSSDYGIHWSQPKLLMNTTGAYERGLDSDSAYITSNGTIYMLVEEYNSGWYPYLYSSSDNGQTWHRYQVTSGGINGALFFNEYSNTLYEIGGSPNLLISNSTNYGQSWSSSHTTFNASSTGYSNAFIDNKGSLWLAFSESKGSNPGIYYYEQDNFAKGTKISKSGNHPPTAYNIQLTPTNAITSSTLMASWTYNDQDGDPHQSSYIRWYKKGVLQSALTNISSVSNIYTTKSDQWYFKLQVFDGFSYSVLYTSPTVTILDSAPIASNLQLTFPAYTNTNLTASFTTSDADGDPIGSPLIQWYRNGSLQASLTNLTTISSVYTLKSDVWYFTVILSDGQLLSSAYQSSSVTILDTAPTASNIVLGPTSATTTNNLVASWSYFDLDGDPSSTALIQWYKNGVLQSGLNNLVTVSSVYTAKGDIWYFTVQVFDGQLYSSVYSSNFISIVNSVPTITNLQLTTPAYTTTTLTISYTYYDADSDPQFVSGTKITWYQSGTLVPALTNSTSVSSAYTTKGQTWYCLIQVTDGQNYSIVTISPTITILNSAPTLTNIHSTTPPLNSSDLMTYYTYYDVDGDPMIQSSIIWYKNGVQQLALNNQSIVLSSLTNIGDQWQFSMWVYDGSNKSITYSSSIITILADNAPYYNSVPSNISYIVGTTGIDLSWNASDNNPTTFDLYTNGILNQTGNWASGVTISISLDGLQAGYYNYTLIIYDADGFAIPNTVFVTARLLHTPVFTVIPTDFNFTKGSYVYMTWKANDDNPTTYYIYANGVLINSSVWYANISISQNVSGLPVGTNNITMVLYDGDNLFVSATTIVNVLHIPVFISVPTDFNFTKGAFVYMTWKANDDNPTMYYIYENGVLVNSSIWFANITIYQDVSGLQAGINNITIVLYDANNFFISGTTFVTVLENTPVITSYPASVNYQLGTSGNTLIWTASDANPNTYIVYKDGSIYNTGVWKSGQAITINIDGLGVGTYNFTIAVSNIYGTLAFNTVTVTVTQPIQTTTPSSTTSFPSQTNPPTSIKQTITASPYMDLPVFLLTFFVTIPIIRKNKRA